MASGRYSLFSSLGSYDIEKMPLLAIDSEEDMEIDFTDSFSQEDVDTSDNRFIPLKVALLQGLLDECLSLLDSASKKQHRQAMKSILYFGAGLLMIIGGTLSAIALRGSVNKKSLAFKNQYSGLAIPSNVSDTQYTCGDVNIMAHYGGGRSNQLSLLDPDMSCGIILSLFNKGFITPFDPKIPQELKVSAWDFCSSAILDLCRDFKRNHFFEYYLILMAFIPISAGFIFLGIKNLRESKVSRFYDVIDFLSDQENHRMLDILRVFDLSPGRYEKIEDVSSKIKNIKDGLTKLEGVLFFEDRLVPKQFKGEDHHFFSKIKDGVLDDRKAVEEKAMDYWSAARKAAIFKR